MSDEPKTPVEEQPKADKKPSATPYLDGLDESVIAAADNYVQEKYLDTPAQQTAIQRMRDRALHIYHDYRNDAWFRAEASVRLAVTINIFFSC
jgi:hypothetical protein